MHHLFLPGTGVPVLALHGTGGDEHDLVPLVRAVAPGRPILSPRGNVQEFGANRFFARLAEGRFDPAEVERRAHELADFLEEAAERYGFALPIDAVGYSNGANIAGALLTVRPRLLRKAVLLRAMLALKPDRPADLQGVSALLLSGAQDRIIPGESARQLEALLRSGGAAVEAKLLPADHGLTQADIGFSATFMS